MYSSKDSRSLRSPRATLCSEKIRKPERLQERSSSILSSVIFSRLRRTLNTSREINKPSLRLMIDTADQNITDVADAVRKVAKDLGYVHFSDNEGHGLGLPDT